MSGLPDSGVENIKFTPFDFSLKIDFCLGDYLFTIVKGLCTVNRLNLENNSRY